MVHWQEIGEFMKIYDISMTVCEGMMVYPNNPEPKIEQVKRMPESTSNQSKLTLGAHTGTHMDALLHARNGGWAVDDVDLRRIVGKCRVLDLTNTDVDVGEEALRKFKIKKGEIILLKTKNSERGFEKFRDDFIHVTLDGAKYLAGCGISAVGIDSLGIQKRGSGNMLVHEAILEKGIPIFEGLDLSKVPAGSYFFVGLPLKVAGAEAAPARAVLIKD